MQFIKSVPQSVQSIVLLTLCNVFMAFAWHGHLKIVATAPWFIAVLASRGIAVFEYLLQVPASRVGFQHAGFDRGQLKVMQEVIRM